MANNMTDEQIDKIAQAIAAKMAKPAGPAPLGCGSVSSSQDYGCDSGIYTCSASYECGGDGTFFCTRFECRNGFNCPVGSSSQFSCTYGDNAVFFCTAGYGG